MEPAHLFPRPGPSSNLATSIPMVDWRGWVRMGEGGGGRSRKPSSSPSVFPVYTLFPPAHALSSGPTGRLRSLGSDPAHPAHRPAPDRPPARPPARNGTPALHPQVEARGGGWVGGRPWRPLGAAPRSGEGPVSHIRVAVSESEPRRNRSAGPRAVETGRRSADAWGGWRCVCVCVCVCVCHCVCVTVCECVSCV